MSVIRSRGNFSTELRFITLLRGAKITGWRRSASLFGRPDFVFPNNRVVVFIDGEFWHGHPTRGRTPVQNSDYWRSKIARNRARDRLVTRTLRSQGWAVLRIWEHQLGRIHAKRTLKRLHAVLTWSPPPKDRLEVRSVGRATHVAPQAPLAVTKPTISHGAEQQSCTDQTISGRFGNRS